MRKLVYCFQLHIVCVFRTTTASLDSGDGNIGGAGNVTHRLMSGFPRRLGPWPDKNEIVVQCGFVQTVRFGSHGAWDALSGNCVCDDSHFTEQAASPCGTEKKSRVTAILLHVFVGGFGVSAFFVGWTTWGVLLLLMCCLPLCCICCVSAAVTGVVGDGTLQDDSGASALCGGLGATCMVCVTTVLLCVGQVFWILAIVWMADSSAADGDGVPLE